MKLIKLGRKLGKIAALASGVAGLSLALTMVLANPGDPVPPNFITPPGPSGSGCGGIGVAFDGVDILYTCANESKIRKTNLAGADMGFIDTTQGGDPLKPISVDAIAWDPTENKIWGGELIDTDANGAHDTCRIYRIDPTNGNATIAFDRVDTGCDLNYFDGLTVDTVTDTLYYSPDVQKYINHLKKDGTSAANDSIDFETLTSGPDRCPNTEPFPDNDPVAGCNNSGLAIGLDGNLFAGTNGEGKIMQVNPVTKTLIGEFTTVSGRDEDMECGPVIEGKETILSRDFNFPGRIDILEVPKGTCVSPVVLIIDLNPSFVVNPVGMNHTVTATITGNGNPVSGQLVSFEVLAGPNMGEVSDPNMGECVINNDCTTDVAGNVSWTYTSNGMIGMDVIAACFINAAGEKQCANKVKKEWIDRTPPEISCIETVNPHGQTIPPAGKTTLPGPKGGQNEDGFYQLFAKDNIDPIVQIYVTDAYGSGPLPFGFGPFMSGDKVKITEANGTTPSMKKIGSVNGQAGAIAAHILLKGDPLIIAVDAAGNKSSVTCLVPPPPKQFYC